MRVHRSVEFSAVGLISLFFVLASVARAQNSSAARPLDQHALFAVVGSMYRLDPDLLAAIARAESGGAADAVSSAGAQGLMQLMPATARRFGVTHPFDSVESALGAAQYLDALRAASPAGGQLPDLLAAYNAGEGAVIRYDGIPPYRETRQYVARVLQYYLLDDSTPIARPRAHQLETQPPFHAGGPSATDSDRCALDQLADLKAQRTAALAQASAQ